MEVAREREAEEEVGAPTTSSPSLFFYLRVQKKFKEAALFFLKSGKIKPPGSDPWAPLDLPPLGFSPST